MAKLSNRTWAKQRPPLLPHRVNAALLARFGFKKIVHAQKPAAPKRESKKTHSTPGRASASTTQGNPAATRLPAASKPQAQKLPDQKPPAATPTSKPGGSFVAKRQTPSQPPAQKKPETRDLSEAAALPAASQTPVAKEPPAVSRPPAANNQPKTNNPPAGNLPEVKKQPDAENIPAPKATPEPNTPPVTRNLPERNVPEKPFGMNSSEVKAPGLNGLPANGKEAKTSGTNSVNGANSNGYGPVNGKNNGATNNGMNGTGNHVAHSNGNGNGVNGNGMKGSSPRSPLFRPGAFSSMPSMRIPPRVVGPTQVPFEAPQKPDGQVDPPVANGKLNNPEPAATNPIPPKMERTGSTDAGSQPGRPAGTTPGLDQLIKQNAGLPSQAAILGVCEDGLPVLLDLQDPTPGAMVVIGDEREKQLEILRTALTSVVGRNSPRSVQFLVFSCEPQSWQTWIKAHGFDRHCLSIESADEAAVRNWIVQLADWTEQRRMGQSSGPAVLLIMDTLSFLPQLSYDIRLNFDWLAKEGPQAHIWPLAVISTDLAKSLSGRRMLRGFQTRVMGYANNPSDYVPLAGVNQQDAAGFGRRGEFLVKVGENWLRFRLPGK